MFHVLRDAELERNAARSVTFIGEAYRAGVSFFIEDADPGKGPRLHRHPYAETFIVRSGKVRFRVGTGSLEAGPGDIVVVEANTPHGFTAIERLDMVCIHAAERMVTEWLEPPPG